jgi:hypothetical protein
MLTLVILCLVSVTNICKYDTFRMISALLEMYINRVVSTLDKLKKKRGNANTIQTLFISNIRVWFLSQT